MKTEGLAQQQTEIRGKNKEKENQVARKNYQS